MNDIPFDDGYIKFSVEEIPEQDIISLRIDLNNWDDGYFAFSNCEKRLDEIRSKTSFHNLIAGNHSLQDIHGYLIEIDLWRNRNSIFEEISIERDDNCFLYQKWSLGLQACDDDGIKCYFRTMKTMFRENTKLFKDHEIESIEVVVPEKRLHFFITKKVEKHESFCT